MANTPTAILVLSSQVSGRHSAPAVEALVAGALDAVPKPMRWTTEAEQGILRQVRLLSKAVVVRHQRPPVALAGPPGRPGPGWRERPHPP